MNELQKRGKGDRQTIRNAYEYLPHIHKLPGIGEAKYIIDGGAHIGGFTYLASAIWSKNNPIIAAVEPHIDNFRMLKLNKRHMKSNPVLINKALSYTPNPQLRDRGVKDWSGCHHLITNDDVKTFLKDINIRYPDEGLQLCEPITIEQIMEECKMPYIDLLKLDIEASEYEILRRMNSSHVRYIVGEYHHRAGKKGFEKFCNDNLYEIISIKPNHKYTGIFTLRGDYV